MCVLTTSAQHTRRHSRHRNTAVAQPVETKSTVKENGRHATAAVDNKQTTTPVTPLRGRKPTVEKIQYQAPVRGRSHQQVTATQQQGKLQQQHGKQQQQHEKPLQQQQIKGQQVLVKGQQVAHGKAAATQCCRWKERSEGSSTYVTTAEIKDCNSRTRSYNRRYQRMKKR